MKETSAAQQTKQKKVWDRIWSGPVSYNWDPLSQTVYERIVQTVGLPEGLHIAEAGSGTGKISLRLAEEGAAVTLIDYSEQALAVSRNAFRDRGAAATYLLADIRDTGLPDSRFDLTWNAGVLEHFDPGDQAVIVREMARITKPGGFILILTPSAKCLPYRAGKAVAERTGTWMYGVEHPVESMHEAFKQADVTLLEESHTGFLDSLAFLDFIPGSAPVKEAISSWYTTLGERERQLFPGYLLCSPGIVAEAK